MKNIDIKYNNNYSIAEQIFDETLLWAASKNPVLTREQFISNIEKLLEKIEDKEGNYRRGYNRGYKDCEVDNESNCCGKNR